jgi:pimeloyl-ACP methyl ester carboxylesterase
MTPIYARYNTGRHISANGRELAGLLEALVAAYPGELAEIALIGHSMGGLVARSACHYGQEYGHRWVAALRRVICLGSPHLGAPLEKAGGLLSRTLRRFNAAGAQIPAQLLDMRSVGIKDLRSGLVADDEWRGRRDAELRDEHRAARPLVAHATLHHVAATLTENPAHPLSAVLGDALVRVPSASGRHRVPARSLPFETHHGVVVGGVSHLRLVNHPRVYAQLRRWCAGESPDTDVDLEVQRLFQDKCAKDTLGSAKAPS